MSSSASRTSRPSSLNKQLAQAEEQLDVRAAELEQAKEAYTQVHFLLKPLLEGDSTPTSEKDKHLNSILISKDAIDEAVAKVALAQDALVERNAKQRYEQYSASQTSLGTPPLGFEQWIFAELASAVRDQLLGGAAHLEELPATQPMETHPATPIPAGRKTAAARGRSPKHRSRSRSALSDH